MNSLMARTLERAIQGTRPKTAKRMKALAGVRWILASDDGRFVTVNDRAEAMLVPDAAKATVYDGRDNEEVKCRFMQVVLGVPLMVVLLDE